MKHTNLRHQSIALLLSFTFTTSFAFSQKVIVPVNVSASSNAGQGGDQPVWHADTFKLGAKYYDPATGSNVPYGLMGRHFETVECVTSDSELDPEKADYPGHEDYRDETSQHPKPQGLWMTRKGDTADAWVEFELPNETPLSQLWIWNWNDGPETGRRVKNVTIQTSSETTAARQLGKVDYNVTHATKPLPDIGQVQSRTPDLVYTFPPGTWSRYVRLHDMDNFGPHDDLGLAEVFILGSQSELELGGIKRTAPQSAPKQEPDWHLFLDDHIITRSTGFQRVLRQPDPRGVVLKPDKPWETFGVTPWYVGKRKDGLYECYYQAIRWERGGRSVNRIAYAVSKDAIHWEKPTLNLFEGPTEFVPQPGYSLGIAGGEPSKANNILPCGHPRDMFLHGNVQDPKRRYAIGLDFRVNQRVGFCEALPDFLNDPASWQDKIVEAGYKPSHYNALEFWDEINKEWVAMRQAPNHPPVRCGGRYASPDLKNWKLEHYIYPDAHDSTDPRYFDEIYGVMGLYTEGFVLGVLSWFVGDMTHVASNNDRGIIGKDTAKGTMEVRIVTSRDGGKTWDRTVSREAWIPHGTQQHSYDRLVRVDCPPLRMGDEDWFYGTVYNGDHWGGYYHDGRRSLIQGALYVQKHNRYVSLTAGNDQQILITKPIKVTGKTLQLNVDGSRGDVRVGIGIDKVIPHKHGAWGFKAILPQWMVKDRWDQTHLEPGFHINDCESIQADCIEHNVRWKEARLESLLGKTVRLYIMVQDADLYAFRFR